MMKPSGGCRIATSGPLVAKRPDTFLPSMLLVSAGSQQTPARLMEHRPIDATRSHRNLPCRESLRCQHLAIVDLRSILNSRGGLNIADRFSLDVYPPHVARTDGSAAPHREFAERWSPHLFSTTAILCLCIARHPLCSVLPMPRSLILKALYLRLAKLTLHWSAGRCRGISLSPELSAPYTRVFRPSWGNHGRPTVL